jgi:5'-nucleotidase
VDDNTNSIIDYKWQLIEINDKIAEPDKKLEEYIASFQGEVDRKYNTLLCKLQTEFTHPEREIETSLGNFIADALAERADCDVAFVGSGSIRVKQIGPAVTLKDFLSCFPYDDVLTKFTLTGELLIKIFSHIMRIENRDGEGECYQVNKKVKAVYFNSSHSLESLSIDGKPVSKKQLYTICIQNFHVSNSSSYLNVSEEELREFGKAKVITTSVQEVLEEHFRNSNNASAHVDGRLIYI